MKTLSTKLILPLFFIFSFAFNTKVEAQVNSLDFASFAKTDFVGQNIFFKAVGIKKQVKKTKKGRRNFFKKWKKSKRKKLGIAAGLLGLFGLLGWRRKFKKLKKKSRRRLAEYGEGGLLQIFLILVGIGLLSMLGSWMIEALFGVMVGFWLGALLGLLVLGAVFGLIWLIIKGMN